MVRRKDSIKMYNYYEMEKAYEDKFLTSREIEEIEKKIDELALEFYYPKKGVSEIPFNKIIRSFFDDARIYYAIKYAEEKGYYIYSHVDIECDSPCYIYSNTYRPLLPECLDSDKQEAIVKEAGLLKLKITKRLLELKTNLKESDVADFFREEFFYIISSIDDEEFNMLYDEYLEKRNILVTHNIRAFDKIVRNNRKFFYERDEAEDFSYFYTLKAVEKYFRKFYSLDSNVKDKYGFSSFMFTSGRFSLLNFERERNDLVYRRTSMFTAYQKVKKLYASGKSIEEVASTLGCDVEYVNYLENLFSPVVSLDSEMEYDEVCEEEAFNSLVLEDLKDSIYNILASLDDRDKLIIMYRFGLIDGECWSLQKIGDKLNLTRERVRQIQNSVMRLLKNDSIKEGLRDFVR